MLVAEWYGARLHLALLQFDILLIRSQLSQHVDIGVIMYSAVRISFRSVVLAYTCGRVVCRERPVTLCCCGAMVPPWLVGIIVWDNATFQTW